jgi:hypothetical protein
MKIEIKSVKNNNQEPLELYVEYSKSEWERIKQYYDSNPEVYRIGQSANLFGVGVNANVYFTRTHDTTIAENIAYRIREEVESKEHIRIDVIDNINKPLIYIENSYLILNIALFRIIPQYDQNTNKYVIRLPLAPTFCYLPGFKFYRYIVREFIKQLELYQTRKKVKLIYRLEVVEE